MGFHTKEGASPCDLNFHTPRWFEGLKNPLWMFCFSVDHRMLRRPALDRRTPQPGAWGWQWSVAVERGCGEFGFYSLTEFLDFKLFEKTIFMANKKFRLFWAKPLKK